MNFQVVIDSLTKIVTDILLFIPNLVNGLIILLIGYMIARLVRWIVDTVLRRVRFDPLVERTGVTGSLRGLGVKAPLSRILAQTIFLLLLISFLITATRLMGLEAVARLLEEILNFLPSAIAALIVFLLGGVAAKFLGDLVGAMASGAGISYAGRLARFVQHVVSIFVVIIALGVLGIDTSILVTALTIMIAAFGLAISLALGLGARGFVQHILAGYYMRQRFPVGQPIAFGDVRGQISSVGSVNTLVTNGASTVVIPNMVLLESLVQSPAQPPADPPQPAQ